MAELATLVPAQPALEIVEEPEVEALPPPTGDNAEEAPEPEKPEETPEEPEPEEKTDEGDKPKEKPEAAKNETPDLPELNITQAALDSMVNRDETALAAAQEVYPTKLKARDKAILDEWAPKAQEVVDKLERLDRRIASIKKDAEDENRKLTGTEQALIDEMAEAIEGLEGDLIEVKRGCNTAREVGRREVYRDETLRLHPGLSKFRDEYNVLLESGWDPSKVSARVALAACMTLRAEKSGKPIKTQTTAEIKTVGVQRGIEAARKAAVPAARGSAARGGGSAKPKDPGAASFEQTLYKYYQGGKQ